jgi:hypothetical protein
MTYVMKLAEVSWHKHNFRNKKAAVMSVSNNLTDR